MSRRTVYLDYNASAPLLPEARAAMIDAMDKDGNPASVHGNGRAAKALVQKARRQVADLVNAKPEHVVFTSGATEAASTLLTPRYAMGRAELMMSHLYVCASDHPCTLGGGQFSKKAMTVVPVTSDGLIDLPSLETSLSAHDKTSGTALIACHHVNSETGGIQPVEEISAVAKAHGAVLVLDCAQSAGRVSIDITDGHADFLIVSSHKIGGPKGAGAIIAFSDLMMPTPLLTGGGQERGHRSGTEAVTILAGFGAAAEVAKDRLTKFESLKTVRDTLINDMRTRGANIVVHAENAPRVGNTVYLSVPGKKAETLQIAFDLAGFAVSSGSACSSGKVGKSHVLAAMGVNSDEGAIRMSFSPDTAPADLNAFTAKLLEISAR
ncbi:MAG: cysteine desulfurase family protein [Pseudomonadota bacterium]